MDARAAWDGFADDLASSLRAWRRAWWLPLVSLFITTGAFTVTREVPGQNGQGAGDGGVVGLLVLLFIPLLLVIVAWPGVERTVYARLFGARPEPPGERIGSALLNQLGRFFRLGLLVVVIGIVPGSIANIAGGAVGHLVSLAFAVAVGTWLTFVTPELALATDRVMEATRRGQGLLRERWSEVRFHVLVPAVTLAILGEAGAAVGVEGNVWGAGLVACAFKGATVRRWLAIREAEVSPT